MPIKSRFTAWMLALPNPVVELPVPRRPLFGTRMVLLNDQNGARSRPAGSAPVSVVRRNHANSLKQPQNMARLIAI
jgi:hypothetical protein